MTQNFVDRIYNAYKSGCIVKHGKYSYTVRLRITVVYHDGENEPQTIPWVYRCPAGKEFSAELTETGVYKNYWTAMRPVNA